MVLRRFVSGARFALAVMSVLPISNARAATFDEAPELAQRLVDLRPIYGWPASWPEPLGDKTIARSRFSGNSNDLPRVIAMNGVIEAGDLEKFQKILFNDPAGQYRTAFLALQSSPGGSLSEAKRIGEFIHEMIYDSPDGAPSGIVVFRKSELCLSWGLGGRPLFCRGRRRDRVSLALSSAGRDPAAWPADDRSGRGYGFGL